MVHAPSLQANGPALSAVRGYTRARAHICTSPLSTGSSTPAVNSWEGTKCYFREQTEAALQTDLAGSKHANHTVDKPTNQQPKCRHPRPQRRCRSPHPFPELGANRLGTRGTSRCRGGPLGNEREQRGEGKQGFNKSPTSRSSALGTLRPTTSEQPKGREICPQK